MCFSVFLVALNFLNMEKNFKRLVDNTISSSSRNHLSATHVADIKDFVRSNADVGPAIAWSVLSKYFKGSDCHHKIVILRLCDLLFVRSQRFRSCILNDFDRLGLFLDKDGALRDETLIVLDSWLDTFGAQSQQISLAINFLKSKFKLTSRIMALVQNENQGQLVLETDEKKSWEISQVVDQINAEFIKMKEVAERLRQSLQEFLEHVRPAIGSNMINLVPSEQPRMHESGSGPRSEQILSELALFTSNYEVEVSVRKLPVVCDRKKAQMVLDGAKTVQSKYLPRLCEWEQRIVELVCNDQDHVLNTFLPAIIVCKKCMLRSVHQLGSIALNSAESSEDDLEDVPL
jgi:hypothetical protein